MAVILALYLSFATYLLASGRPETIVAAQLALHTIMAAMVAYPLWHTWRWQRQPGRWVRRNLVMVPQTSSDAVLSVILYSVFVWQLGIDHGRTRRPEIMLCFAAAAAILLVRGVRGLRTWRRSWQLVADGVVCAECGYNLTGLESSRCPECGSRLGPVREITQGRLHGRVRQPI